MSVYAMGASDPLERFSQEVSELADDTSTEGQHADDEDHALDDGDPRAELRQIVLQRHHDERADTGPNTVPSPPSSGMSTTSPDIVQWTAVRGASWKTSAFVPPARPANVAESTKPGNLERP